MTAELRAGHRSRESSRVTETWRWQRSEGWVEAVQTQRLLRALRAIAGLARKHPQEPSAGVRTRVLRTGGQVSACKRWQWPGRATGIEVPYGGKGDGRPGGSGDQLWAGGGAN